MNKGKLLALALALAIFFGQIPILELDVKANSGEQLIGQKVDAGYFDLWRHADGVRWQDTDYDGSPDKPGMDKNYGLSITIPQGYYENYKDIRYEIIVNFEQAEYEAAGGYKNYSFAKFDENIDIYKPNDYRHVSGNMVAFKLEGRSSDQTKSWQGKNVRGLRYYLPFIVRYYGVPITPPLPIDDPNPPVVVVPPEPPTPPIMEPNERPVASFTASKLNPKEYESISFTNLSYHPNPKENIVAYLWEFRQYNEIQDYYDLYKTSRDPGTISWPKAGNYRVSLTVTDQDGETDTCVEIVSVDEAIPVAVITAPKEAIIDREVVISGDKSYSPGFDEIIREKNTWEIYRPDGSLAWSGQQRYPRNEAPPNNLFNIVGNWKICLMVEDEDGTNSEWTEETVNILPDNPPIAEFALPENSVRFIVGDYEISATSNSRSDIPDRYFGEKIFRHAWTLYYDNDNNGSYETLIEPNTDNAYAELIVDGENDKTPKIRAFRTGRFRLDLQVQERYFGWGTFHDGLTATVSREFVVENMAPIGLFKTEPIRSAEIVFVVDGVENQADRVLSIENNINALRQQLLNNNIKADIKIIEEINEHPWPQAGYNSLRSNYNGFNIIAPYDLKKYYVPQLVACTQGVLTREGTYIQNLGRGASTAAYDLKNYTFDGSYYRPQGVWGYANHVGSHQGEVNKPPALSPDGQTVYITDRWGHLHAVNAKTGVKKWHTETLGSGITEIIVDKNEYVYQIGEKWVRKIDKDGNILWTEHGQGFSHTYSAVDENENIYGINYAYYYGKRSFWALDKDGNKKYLIDEDCNGFAIDDEYVYLSINMGEIIKINKTTGVTIAEFLTNDINHITVKENYLYASRDYELYKIDKNTGEIMWQKDIGKYASTATLTEDKVLITSNHKLAEDYYPYAYLDIFDINSGESLAHLRLDQLNPSYGSYFSAPMIGNNGKAYIRVDFNTLLEIGDINLKGELASFSRLKYYDDWSENSPYRFVVSVSDTGYSDMSNAENVTKTLNNLQANLFIIGQSNFIQEQAKEVFNLIEGDYIQGASDMAAPLTELGTKISSLVNSKASNVPFVVLVNEELNYITNYIDLEKDPKIDEYWYFAHDNTKIGSYSLSNDQGKDVTVDNKTVPTPFIIFTKPGNYKTEYYVKDQIPWTFYRNHLQAGNKWSIPLDRTIIVHRRPIAGFTTNKNTYNMGEEIFYNNTSYDPDLQHTDPTGHKGISKTCWRYKNIEGDTWEYSDYPPKTLDKPGKWYIAQQVKDIHGAWSEWFTVALDIENKKPIAKFISIPKTAGRNQDIQLLDYSYDPDGHEIIEWEWDIEDIGYSNEYSPIISYDSIGVKNITLKVKDDFGAWSEPYMDTVSIVNNPIVPPIARFNPTPNPVAIDTTFSFNETSYHPQGYEIINKTWYVKEPGEVHERIFYNTQPPQEYMVSGDYIISLEVEDENNLISERETKVLKVLDFLNVEGNSDKEVYYAGEAMILDAKTEGRAYKVEAEMWWTGGNDFSYDIITQLIPEKNIGDSPPDTNNWITRHDVKGNDYDVIVIIPKDMPDGTYQVKFKAFRKLDDGAIEEAIDTINIRVEGSQYNRIRTRIIG